MYYPHSNWPFLILKCFSRRCANEFEVPATFSRLFITPQKLNITGFEPARQRKALTSKSDSMPKQNSSADDKYHPKAKKCLFPPQDSASGIISVLWVRVFNFY